MRTLENLQLDATKSSPLVSFNTSGELKIEGKAIPDNAINFFDPLFMWIDKLNSENVVFDINLEYMNTSASMQLFGLLRKLEENCSIFDITVNWHYEADDEDHYETGLMFEERLNRVKFSFFSFV
jgi:uncharacterized protein YkvS